MKLCNFLALDPGYHGKGLERGGRLEQTVWNEFSADRERLAEPRGGDPRWAPDRARDPQLAQ